MTDLEHRPMSPVPRAGVVESRSPSPVRGQAQTVLHALGCHNGPTPWSRTWTLTDILFQCFCSGAINITWNLISNLVRVFWNVPKSQVSSCKSLVYGKESLGMSTMVPDFTLPGHWGPAPLLFLFRNLQFLPCISLSLIACLVLLIFSSSRILSSAPLLELCLANICFLIAYLQFSKWLLLNKFLIIK